MRILLIEPDSQIRNRTFLEPLGLCSLAAYAEKAGHQVKIIHQLNFQEPSSLEILNLARDFQPEVVGFSCLTENYKNGLRIARLLKSELDIRTIFGGVHATAVPEIVQEKGIDLVVRGEGELTLLEILASWESEKELDDIKGIAFLNRNHQVQVNPPRERITDLDALPFPQRDGLPLRRYNLQIFLDLPISRQKACSICSSRGCPFNCSFCNSPSHWGRRWIARSAASIIAEIEYVQEKYQANLIFFRDEEPTLNRPRMQEICEEIARRGLKIQWGSFARVDSIDESFLKILKSGGCRFLSFGIETNLPESQERIGKKINPSEILQTLKTVSSRGITTQCHFVIGFPWETRDSLSQEMQFISRLDADFINIHFAAPYPGTDLFEQVKNSGLLFERDTNRWTHSVPVMRTYQLDQKELLAFHRKMFFPFYLNPRYFFRTLKKILNNPFLLRSYIEFIFFAFKSTWERFGSSRSGLRYKAE
jgi:radical SAM superfamily enzyme YgiQ (UPF0313 family)